MVPRARRDRPAREAPLVTRKPLWLIAAGLAALLAFAISTLPPTVFAGRAARYGITAVSWSGSIWSGTATGLAWRGASLGELRWRIAPLTLLRGRLGAHVQLVRPDGHVEADIMAGFGGDVLLTDTTVDLPVAVLSDLPVGLPKGWRGQLQASFAELKLEKGWPASVQGTIDMDTLIAPPPRNTSIGSYHAILPDPQAQAGTAPGISARVKDKEGPFAVDGRVTLSPDRSFLLEGTLAPRGDTPPALRRSLELLGPADAAGRRPISVSGTL
jgi:general secretion pathway protein N